MIENELLGQLGQTYQRFNALERQSHVAMLQSVNLPQNVVLDYQPAGSHTWQVTVCTADCTGALSTIAGLFTAYGLDILSVDVFTLRYPQPAAEAPPRQSPYGRRRPRPASPLIGPPQRKILDIFQVRALDDPDSEFWQQLQSDMAGLFDLLAQGNQNQAREIIIDRVSEAARSFDESYQQLLPVDIEVDNRASVAYTRLVIRSEDTIGFLFAFTNALAMFNVNIEHAEIRTIDGQVEDTFWLTDDKGQKIQDEKRLNDLRIATVLIKYFTRLLPRSPNPAQALRQFNALTQQMLSHPEWQNGLDDLQSPEVLETLANLMGVSQFLWEDFLRMQHENLFPVLVDAPALDDTTDKQQLCREARRELEALGPDADPVRALNRFKDREMFRIDLRHITGRVGFREFSQELADLAEVVVTEAARLSLVEMERRTGAPVLDLDSPGQRHCPWCVCALGKFGGRELGFGSDIELIFVYQGEGKTTGPAVIENSRFFGDLVRAFLNTITTQREGIFQIDLRLRPYGNPGPLASTLSGFTTYYSPTGDARQFERLALVKLRPVAGDSAFSQQVTQARDAFVYSGVPLDLENILHLRRRQAEELVSLGALNAKHSPGGLVDVEYFVQACQISAGHRDARVRESNTLAAIDRLEQGGHIAGTLAEELREIYGFQRRLIDALRVVRGHAKDLTIPDTSTREFTYLAQRLKYTSPAQLREAITRQMERARRLWDASFPT